MTPWPAWRPLTRNKAGNVAPATYRYRSHPLAYPYLLTRPHGSIANKFRRKAQVLDHCQQLQCRRGGISATFPGRADGHTLCPRLAAWPRGKRKARACWKTGRWLPACRGMLARPRPRTGSRFISQRSFWCAPLGVEAAFLVAQGYGQVHIERCQGC